MADNPKKKKQDRKMESSTQQWEKDYKRKKPLNPIVNVAEFPRIVKLLTIEVRLTL